MAARLVVGIDLGTTNSCLAWTAEGRDIAVLPILQATRDGRAERSTLPSVLYAPLAEETFDEPFCDRPWLTGELARDRGAEVLGRTVTSAKSWLSHPGNEPDLPTLPLGAAAGAPRLSPIEASARVLSHLARAFEHTTRLRLRDASVVLTLPASFDESARAATLEAATRAGLQASLLEEPQAAFYDFMAKEGALQAMLGRKRDALVLVVDVGGGTTDLSLISVERDGADVRCKRVATGEHLLLGGDNMDLALVALARTRIDDGDELDAFRTGQLLQQCRAAKEALLSEGAPTSYPVAIAKKGARLVGGAATARLTRAEVRKTLLDGFFPSVEAGRPPAARRPALVAAGLPYARDAAVTRHVARFLDRYGGGRAPDFLLLNGGVFRSELMRQTLTSAIRAWTGQRLVRLEESSPDLAVARGAARYGVVRLQHGARPGDSARIEAGATRSYYVGVSDSAGARRAVCVVPRGTAEGVRTEVATPVLRLRTGELARFELYRAKTGVVHPVGHVVDPADKAYAQLRPLLMSTAGASGLVEVTLSGELTPVGTLDLSLRERGGRERSFALAFQVRAAREASDAMKRGEARGDARIEATPPRTTSPRLKQAEALIDAAFSFASKEGPLVQRLVRDLEGALGDRLAWGVQDARGLFDVLLERRGARRWSAEHERAFWALAGLCLRPGFGAPGDDVRQRELYPLLLQGAKFGERGPVGQAFFVACRRVAPGLGATEQNGLFRELRPLLGNKSHAASESELRELLTGLERIDASSKAALGEVLVTSAETTRTPPSPRVLADLARLAARVPAYGPTTLVVPPAIVDGWLARLPTLDAAHPAAASSLVKLGRMTGVASRDLPEKTRRRLAKQLLAAGVAKESVVPLKAHVPLSQGEQGQRFGEALPPGLLLPAEEATS
ncbi:MAG: Hsp70 family protein [Myxococcales bacterium]|nr:Hsp70 family protein [Myxococcales bacterium]